MKDYYAILDLAPDASAERIREQYRFLIHAWHPDKFPGSEHKARAQERTKEVNEAYETLGDPAKRARYDAQYASQQEEVKDARAEEARRRAQEEREEAQHADEERHAAESHRQREQAEEVRRRNEELQRQQEQAEAAALVAKRRRLVWYGASVAVVAVIIAVAVIATRGGEASSTNAGGAEQTASTLSLATSATASQTVASTTTSLSTTTTALPSPGTVLYHAGGKDGFGGWALSSNWKQLGDMIVSDGSDSSIAIAPLDLGQTANYRVEAEIQWVKSSQYDEYGVVARLLNGNGYLAEHCQQEGKWYLRLTSDYYSEFASSDTSQSDGAWHKFVIEVKGNSVRMLFDGGEVLSASDNRFLEPGTVGIYSRSGCQINVRSFTVTAL